jgi:ketosteroid isomerase-like protein
MLVLFKTKIKIMKIFITIFMLTSVLFSFAFNDDLQNMMNTDRTFSKMSEEKGMSEAFVYYADENVILTGENRPPVMGIEELKLRFNRPKNPDVTLTWEPLKGEMSQSGELGYTFGRWQINSKTESGADTITNGVYITVWKKQTDGSWKYVLDGGNLTPEQVTMK